MRILGLLLVSVFITGCWGDNPYGDSQNDGDNPYLQGENPYDNLGGPAGVGGWGEVIEGIPNIFDGDNPYGNSSDGEWKTMRPIATSSNPTAYPTVAQVNPTATALPTEVIPSTPVPIPTDTPVPYVPPTPVPYVPPAQSQPPQQQPPVQSAPCVCRSQFKPGEVRYCGEPPHPGDESKCTANGQWVRIR